MLFLGALLGILLQGNNKSFREGAMDPWRSFGMSLD